MQQAEADAGTLKEKFVVKACEGGKEKLIRYGDKNRRSRRASREDASRSALGTSVIPIRQASYLLATGRVKTGDDMPISRAQMGKQVKNAPKSKR